MGKEPDDIEEQLRTIILSSGMSRYRLSKLSGVSEGQLSRFVMDKNDPRHRTLTMTSAARVAKVLGLRLDQVESAKERKER